MGEFSKWFETVLVLYFGGKSGSSVLALLVSGLTVQSSLKGYGSVCNSVPSVLSSVTLVLLAAPSSGESSSEAESSAVVMVTSQPPSFSACVSPIVVRYLNPSSTDFPTAGPFVGVRGDFTLGLQ